MASSIRVSNNFFTEEIDSITEVILSCKLEMFVVALNSNCSNFARSFVSHSRFDFFDSIQQLRCFVEDSNFLKISAVRAVLLMSMIFVPKSTDTCAPVGSNDIPDKDTDLNPLLANS